MDWIEETYEKWRDRIRNFSLRKALIVYMVEAVIITICAVLLTLQGCSSWRNLICRVNGIEESYLYMGDGGFVDYDKENEVRIIYDDKFKQIGKVDAQLYELTMVIQIICIPIYSIVAIILVALTYYRNRLKEPIFLLKTEMESIARNDMSFSCHYDSADEMGDICKAMDAMRCEVVKNQKMMWELMEEQRKINAAFAHDLRTPLTVINGYVEMLQEYYPKGTISQEQILAMLDSIKGQTKRLEAFSQTMKEVQGFEMLEVKKSRHTGEELQRDICNMAKGVEAESGLTIEVISKLDNTDLYYDENVVTEVLGNLLSNALRYGKEIIQIQVEQQKKNLFLYVKDDGRGMTKEELYKADSPYYSDKTQSVATNAHFGLGLTICKILCKKHGGAISFTNSIDGGAIVCAKFYVG